MGFLVRQLAVLSEDYRGRDPDEFIKKSALAQRDIFEYLSYDKPEGEYVSELNKILSASALRNLAERGIVNIVDAEKQRVPYAQLFPTDSGEVTLTDQQQRAFDEISASKGQTFLLHGVTGSGKTEVYNPWSVINYVEQVWADPNAFPQPFWSNTSSNSIVRTLVENADIRVKQEIETLIGGESIEKPIHEDITYDDIQPDKSRENIWNFLFFTGYLRKTGERMEENVRYISMTIPNEEVRFIFKNTVLNWFEKKVSKKDLRPFYKSILQGHVEAFETAVSQMLREGISFYDTKEAFYHGFLMGLLNGLEDYYAYSNRESGTGRYDICLKCMDVTKPAVIMELKVAASYGDLEERSSEALKQIFSKQYETELARDGYQEVLCYGIAFYKKNCRIKLSRDKIFP